MLYEHICACSDEFSLEMYRQSWDRIHRPQYASKTWSPEQCEVLKRVSDAVSFDDEEERRRSSRFLYVQGAPGSGKSAVMLESAIRSAKMGLTVLIVCPTGALVTTLKLELPDFPGIDRIHVDTLHSVLKYKRQKEVSVSWVPPSAFRKYEVVYCDEGSQYDDLQWKRVYLTLMEQPHSPYCVVVADFQQLQPVSGGDLCRQLCESMHKVELKTVYRSTDPQHLVFQNRIREA